MAVVNVRLYELLLETKLNNVFRDTGVTYVIEIRNGATVLQTASVVFENATYSSATGYAQVVLSGSKSFIITSGTTINGIRLRNGTDTKGFLIENVTERVYTANGTYTVSDLIIRWGGK